MKRILLGFLALSFSLHAQVSTHDYIYFCDKTIADTNNSVECLQHFYRDLNEFKKNSEFRFRHYDSYGCIQQPDQGLYDKVKLGTSTFYKPIVQELWKLYNDSYQKGGEIITYLRLEDYKTNLEKGFQLLREMQTIQKAIDVQRSKIAGKIAMDSKTLPANSFIKPYQLFMNAILHEEALIRKLSWDFNDELYIGFAQDEILKSYLETEELLKALKPSNFKLPDMAAIKSCYEGIQLIQKMKQSALNDFNNTSTLDGEHANRLYNNLMNYFNNDILYFFTHFCGQGSSGGILLNYYPLAAREYDMDSKLTPWTVKNLDYSPITIDSLVVTKQSTVLPLAGFQEFNLIVQYINECVNSMDNLYNQLGNAEYTWDNVRIGKKLTKNPIVKFDHFKIPITYYGLVKQNSQDLPVPMRALLMQRVDDMHRIMLVMQDKLFALSQIMSSGAYKEKGSEFIDPMVKSIELLYEEFDQRKEKLYREVRKAHAAYPLAKTNSWNTASSVLLQAPDDSLKVLRQVEMRAYENNQAAISTANLLADHRDLITNELKYMNGIQLIGKNNGNCPYTPYEYTPDYLKTIQEKVDVLPVEIKDKDKVYRDILRMHNRVIEQYNKFAGLAYDDNEYSKNDPMRPVYLLANIYQPMKYHFIPPKPEPKIEVPAVVVEQTDEPPQIYLNFDGYALNNLVLLLDVSSSMNKPGRLSLLKSSFQQLITFMRAGDQVSIVVYSGKAAVHLAPTSASDTATIFQSIKSLGSSGTTNVEDGLSLAYKTARKNLKEKGNNRIILATDGEFLVTGTLYSMAEKNAAQIPLTIFDFSQTVDPLKSIQLLAEKGKGNYVKVTRRNSLEALADETMKN